MGRQKKDEDESEDVESRVGTRVIVSRNFGKTELEVNCELSQV